MANEIEKRNEAFLIYQDENGIARVNVRFEGEDVWLSVEQIMELFDASQQDVSYHINQIYADGEQDAERTHKNFLIVRQEGNRYLRELPQRISDIRSSERNLYPDSQREGDDLWDHSFMGGMAKSSENGGKDVALYSWRRETALPQGGEQGRTHRTRLESATAVVGKGGCDVQG